jgi:hypothetical protein
MTKFGRGLGYYVGMREENARLVQDLRMHIVYLFLVVFHLGLQ